MIKELTLPKVNDGKPFTIHYEIDRFIGEVLIDGEYNHFIEQTGLVGRNDLVVIDLGCNIGTFSLFVYDMCSQIYAIDLGPRCIELLNNTIKDNGFDKIKTFQHAISCDGRRVKITGALDDTRGGLSIYHGGDNEIETITLASFIKEHEIDHIDMLKVDVESAEDEIFTAEDFLEVKDRIHFIFGEAHRDTIPTGLDKNGFMCFVKDRHFIAINTTYAINRTPHKEF